MAIDCETRAKADLNGRYAPHADWQDVVRLQDMCNVEVDVWWASPSEIIDRRGEEDLPLSGLHIAIDPGHIGGVWAPYEGRNFRVSASDFWVREGELVLEVAERVREALSDLGARVTLVRESFDLVNPKAPMDYWHDAKAAVERPESFTLDDQVDYALRVRDRAIYLSAVIGEIVERARIVNTEIRPDLLLSLHINAASWPEGPSFQLVDANHAHVLIFGCMSASELSVPRQQKRLVNKMRNGSGAIEHIVGKALGRALVQATGLPASDYSGDNAIRIDEAYPSLWARNLLLLRLVDCPTVMLEPYIANSQTVYPRLQEALASRASGAPPGENDILIEYADAVVAGVLAAYGANQP